MRLMKNCYTNKGLNDQVDDGDRWIINTKRNTNSKSININIKILYVTLFVGTYFN